MRSGAEHAAFSGQNPDQQKPAADGHGAGSGLPSSNRQQHVQGAPAAFSFGSPAAAEHTPAGRARPRAPRSPRRAAGRVSSPTHAASGPQPAVHASPPAADRPPQPFQFAAPASAGRPQKHYVQKRGAPSASAHQPSMAQQASWSAAGSPRPHTSTGIPPFFPASAAQQAAQAVPPFQAPTWPPPNAEETFPHRAAGSNRFSAAHAPGFISGAGHAAKGPKPHLQAPPPPPATRLFQSPGAFAFGEGTQHTGSAPQQPGACSAGAATPDAAAGATSAAGAWHPPPWPTQPSTQFAGAFSSGHGESWAGSRPEQSCPKVHGLASSL